MTTVGRTTLKDVAERVGVSAKTVSNVVNGTGWVTDDLRGRVKAAIDELGYRPNVAARNLRNGRSGMIAVALPDLSQPYFAELASDLVRAAQERSITVLINQTDGREDAERRIAEGIDIPVMDGLILSPLALTAADFELRTDTTPLILLGEHVGETEMPHVAVDNTAAARAAVEHLIGLGRRRIAAIGAQQSGPNETSVLRLSGYRQALESAGIPFDPALVATVDTYYRGDGAQAAEALLDGGTPFDAVFAFNDLLALGALHVLGARGVSVPGQVAVIGFDNIEEAGYSTPALSSVAPDTLALARTAIDLLTADPPARGIHSIPFVIAARASTTGEDT
ncbi:LacI family DNA-binding transcriptional regulator [Microbacterium pygmaeum]|uniref:LacI family DNA-binding transcriptional regulator n=1 Tax=Microbacterium pygmaeum TaxID=370764 RepID=UPI001E658C53|nr:LacI family DNA-binding transcriptional regulator [Microbacterium pygmaeum]